jgi:peptidoglycan/xylan/chitin deacetylase (PgdA/CDA1 family)
MIKTVMRKVVFDYGPYSTGAHRLIRRRYAGCGVIFRFHSVTHDGDVHLRAPIHCAVKVFDGLIRYLRGHDIEIVTLDTLLDRLEDPHAPRFAVLTFDDGYRDNLTHALPVLEHHAAPATIYVTTGMIERSMDAWWLGLVDWLKRREYIAVDGFGTETTATINEKIAARSRLNAWVRVDAVRLDALRRAMAADGVDGRLLLDQQALTRDELRHLASHPLITIGGHTTSHPWLRRLSRDEAWREIVENRRYLQDLTQQELAHFAYPFGTSAACVEREASLVADAGFCSAVTTRHGCIFPAHREHRYCLPREGVFSNDNEVSIAGKDAGMRRLMRDLRLMRPWRSPVATMTED